MKLEVSVNVSIRLFEKDGWRRTIVFLKNNVGVLSILFRYRSLISSLSTYSPWHKRDDFRAYFHGEDGRIRRNRVHYPLLSVAPFQVKMVDIFRVARTLSLLLLSLRLSLSSKIPNSPKHVCSTLFKSIFVIHFQIVACMSLLDPWLRPLRRALSDGRPFVSLLKGMRSWRRSLE